MLDFAYAGEFGLAWVLGWDRGFLFFYFWRDGVSRTAGFRDKNSAELYSIGRAFIGGRKHL